MLRRVERPEVAACELANAMCQIIPDQYQTRPDGEDSIALTWKDAWDAAIGAWTTIADLGNALREKAGISGEGPTAGCRLMLRSEAADVPRRREPADAAADGAEGAGWRKSPSQLYRFDQT